MTCNMLLVQNIAQQSCCKVKTVYQWCCFSKVIPLSWSQKHTCAHLNHKELVSLLPLLLLSYAHSNCLLWCWAGHHSKPIVLYSWFGSALVSTYQPTPEPLSLSLWFAPFLHSPRWTDFGHHNLQFLVYDDKKKPSSQLSAQNLDAVQYIKNKQH